MNPIIQELIECLRTHARESRVLGNVQAGPAADALETLETQTEYLEEAVRVFRHALVQIKNHTEDPASEITASIALSEQP